jgi:hypothetical protein
MGRPGGNKEHPRGQRIFGSSHAARDCFDRPAAAWHYSGDLVGAEFWADPAATSCPKARFLQ